MIEPTTALTIARSFALQPTALAAIGRNDAGYVVSFAPSPEEDPDAFANVYTWIDGTTGEAQAIGASAYVSLMSSLQVLGRGIPATPAT